MNAAGRFRGSGAKVREVVMFRHVVQTKKAEKRRAIAETTILLGGGGQREEGFPDFDLGSKSTSSDLSSTSRTRLAASSGETQAI